jgi:hypothetical protein
LVVFRLVLREGAETTAVALTVDYGFTWEGAVLALEEARQLAEQRGEAWSPHK